MFRFLPLLSLVFLPIVAQAAQNAIVLGDNAPVYESPDFSATIVHRFKKREIIRIGNINKGGFYAVLLPADAGNGSSGWISAELISTEKDSRTLQLAGVSLLSQGRRVTNRNQFTLFVYGAMNYTSPFELQAFAGAVEEFTFSPSFGVNLGFLINDYFSFLVVGESLSWSGEVTDSNSYSASGSLIGLIFQWEMFYSKPFVLNFSLGGGASLGTSVSATVNSRTFSDSPTVIPAILSKFGLRYHASSGIYLGFDLGYRYLFLTTYVLGNTMMEVDFAAPYAALGLGIDF